MFDLIVNDDFFPEVEALRSDVLAKGFQNVVNPDDGLVYTGIQLREPDEFQGRLRRLVGFPVTVRHSIARLNLKGELPHSDVHADNNMGEFAAVLYLTKNKGPATGTAFWRHKGLGICETPDQLWLAEQGISEADYLAKIAVEQNDIKFWEANAVVFAQPGRIVTYPTKRFHSRYPFEGFGTSPDTGRLVIALFYDRS